MPLLVLDDDPAIRSAVRRHLRDLVDVLPVASRAELERVLLEGNHGLVGALVDVSLGPVDPTGGLVAHTRLRAALPDLPVVFFTASSPTADAAPTSARSSTSAARPSAPTASASTPRPAPTTPSTGEPSSTPSSSTSSSPSATEATRSDDPAYVPSAASLSRCTENSAPRTFAACNAR